MESMSTEGVRKPRILVVDDEVAMVRSLEILLRPVADVTKAYSVPEAEDELQRGHRIDCIITDVSMPEASGLTLLEKVRRKAPETPVIVMTAYSSVPQAVEAMQRGAFEYVVKPFENADLMDVVKKAITKRGVTHGESKSMPKGWICSSHAMREFVSKAEKMAQMDSPLLILGEVGVGKSRAVRWIHEMSPRSRREFFAIDGRTHEEDSPLFLKSMTKVGTVFVAEIFSLPRRLQDKVVEIISEGKVRIIGSASGSPDLQSPPHFREDLYRLLMAMTLRVPSLNERREDFEALVQEIIGNLQSKLKLKKLEIDASAMRKLKGHTFSANVKELELTLEHAAIESKGGVITEASVRFETGDLRQFIPFSIPIEGGWNRLEVLREALERELILRALEKYPDQSNSQIASILGTTRRILELRMKDYKIREMMTSS